MIPLRLLPLAAAIAWAGLMGPPVFAQRISQELGGDWKFIKADAGLDAAAGSWEPVAIPHTWNALDGQDGPTPGASRRPGERGSDYFRGIGWYARSLNIPSIWSGRRVFIYFEAASQAAQVYLNGQRVGEHRGAFTAFCFELTPWVKFGQPNELRVQVDNTLVRTIAPLAGDFNVDGGIYRPVHLLVTDPVCVTPLDHASPGVYLTIQSLKETQAQVEVKTLVSNGLPEPAAVQVAVQVEDAGGQIAASANTTVTLAGGGATQTVSLPLSILQPHFWQGLKDPYLYTARIRILRDNRLSDEVVQPLGLRTVAITEAEGFLLNGQPYPVYGINRHQDLRDHGWAQSAADEERDWQIIRELGATAIRLAHYPQSEHVHALSDRAGLLLWNEVPFVNEVPERSEPPGGPSAETLAFNANLEEQMREMILQRYNHPAAAFWGLFNEIRPNPTSQAALPEVRRLQALAHELDPARPTVAASDRLTNPTNFVSDWMAYNVYPGWYTTLASGNLSKLIDQRFAEQHNRRIGLSEYGAGGNPAQHIEGELRQPTANNGPVHPEEWQSYVHEQDWAQIKDNPKLWGSFIWVMFDFASDGRNEGGAPGINDKGLVTQDRAVKKDAYYFYQANWSAAPMVCLASRRAVERTQPLTEVKVYSNCPEVELFVNGKSLGVVRPDDIHVARWADVRLQPGKNSIVAIGRAAGREYRDACEWNLATPAAAPALGFRSPEAAAGKNRLASYFSAHLRPLISFFEHMAS